MSSVYELVELANGEIALRRADDELHEPMVTIRFSPESLSLLGKSKFAVAKAMIDAAMEAANEDNDENEHGEDLDDGFVVDDSGEIYQLH